MMCPFWIPRLASENLCTFSVLFEAGELCLRALLKLPTGCYYSFFIAFILHGFPVPQVTILVFLFYIYVFQAAFMKRIVPSRDDVEIQL